MLGPPGAGKSMLARRLTTILPAMSLAEAIETTCIHCVGGQTGNRTARVTTRPCHVPHHTITDVGLVGGGHVPMPGEVTWVHHGVLCLDELLRFTCHVLEVLHPPSSTASQKHHLSRIMAVVALDALAALRQEVRGLHAPLIEPDVISPNSPLDGRDVKGDRAPSKEVFTSLC
jgi:predicted ATPase with chaperone activity